MADDVAVLVFDLDDTLYLERDFARSGFAAVGELLKQTMNIDGFARRCEEIFASGQRTLIFDTALEAVGLSGRDDMLARLVSLYRGHAPAISLAPDAERYLSRPERRHRRAIITDGPAETQMAKIRALGLDSKVEQIICTDAWGPQFRKPHERAFDAVEAWSGASPPHIVYVADNPLKDFVTPRARGWQTVRIARADRVHLTEAPDARHEAHATITSFDDLDDCLAELDPFWERLRAEALR